VTDSESLRRYVAEFVGTFVLVAIGPGAVMVASSTRAFGEPSIAAAFGIAVAIVVASTGHVGGAHINPAVTIGLWSARRFESRHVIPYVAAQCLGAVAASGALLWILGPVGNFGATLPSTSIDRAFAVEAGYTALLGFVIMGVAVDKRAPAGIAPFAIGATVAAGALVTGPLTGGSFNPARSFGPALVGHVWTAHWLYWLAPILGAIAGMQLYAAIAGLAVTSRDARASETRGSREPLSVPPDPSS
jgi:MIP family channel proteins